MTNNNFSEISKLCQNFVSPVLGNSQDGCGVFVGNLFITAGHVARPEDFPYYACHDGKLIRLDATNLVSHCMSETISEDSQCGDYSVFWVDGIDSPLRMADYTPEEGQLLYCDYFDTDIIKNPQPGLPEIFTTTDEISQHNTTVTVREERFGNFFTIDSKDILKVGNSGCPLIDDKGKVVGILRGGKPGTPICIFQYASTIDVKR